MPKIAAITDRKGTVIGTVRTDPVPTAQGTLSFHPPITNTHTFHEVEVTEELLRRTPDELHTEIAKLIPHA